MKVLQLVKYYSPSRGGIETVVENIVDGIFPISTDIFFTIYTNSHFRSKKDLLTNKKNCTIIAKKTKYFFKNQPLRFYFKELKTLVSENEIIHLHYPYPNIELALVFMLSIIKHKKMIITWHANIENSRWSFFIPIYNIIINYLLQTSKHIIVTSPSLLDNSKQLQKYNSKVSVIPLSISSKYDYQKLINRQPNKPFKLLFVGKLRKYKGVDILIRSIVNIDVKLTIVGDGAELNALIDLVNYLGVNNKVIFKKALNDLELVQEYIIADLFVLPSINEAEAFGIVQLEAMSFGLPVINTKLNSGVPFVSLHNLTGYTVVPCDVPDLEKAIITIFSSDELYKKFSINAKLRSLKFTNEKMAKSYLNIYNQVLTSN
jgi:glycosyltransferase involved in cell wall biosynthesis